MLRGYRWQAALALFPAGGALVVGLTTLVVPPEDVLVPEAGNIIGVDMPGIVFDVAALVVVEDTEEVK